MLLRDLQGDIKEEQSCNYFKKKDGGSLVPLACLTTILGSSCKEALLVHSYGVVLNPQHAGHVEQSGLNCQIESAFNSISGEKPGNTHGTDGWLGEIETCFNLAL